MTLSAFILYAISLIDLICIIMIIFVERKNPASSIAWVLVIIVIPLGGFIAYALFGSGFHLNKKKRYELKKIADSLYRDILLRYGDRRIEHPLQEEQPGVRLVRYLESEGEYYTNNNDVTLFTKGDELFSAMMDDIRKAEKQIHMLYYIVRNDELGRSVIALLAEKARSGVAVKLIYDSLGSLLSSESLFKPLREAGGQVEAFSPLFRKLSTHVRLNYRNHRKITVVDGVTGYVGGMNIGVEYLGRHKRLTPWRDTHLRLTGSSVSFLQQRFLMDWMSVSERELSPEEMEACLPGPENTGCVGVQIASSGPDTDTKPIKNALLEMIYSAKKRVYIQTPYFIPDDSVTDALCIAARSGVDVRLMLPGIADHFFVYFASLTFARQVLDAGVRVYKYPGFLHAKTLLVDDRVTTIGTANLDTRSLALNFEVNAFVYNRGFSLECARVFQDDMEHCTEVTADWFAKRNPALRALDSACRLLAPLI